MLELLRPVMQTLLPPLRAVLEPRASMDVLRERRALSRAAIRIASGMPVSAWLIEHLMRELYGVGAPTLFLAIRSRRRPLDLVITQRPGDEVVFSAPGHQLHARLEHEAPDGAYLHDREWRRLGFYEIPSDAPAVVTVTATWMPAKHYLVDVPFYVQRATVLVNDVVLVGGARLAETAPLRLRI